MLADDGRAEKRRDGQHVTQPTLARNFLHAAELGFAQPRTGKPLLLSVPLPEELQAFLEEVRPSQGPESRSQNATPLGKMGTT